MIERPPSAVRFKISINYPDKWKIRSIAAFKIAQAKKREQQQDSANNLQKSTVTVESGARIISDRSRSYLESKGVLTVEQRAEIISNMRRTKTRDQIENELMMWEDKCVHIRKQIYNLNLKRSQLIWLLNKSVLTDRASLC